MANADQVQQMLDMMAQQMSHMQTLQKENAQLRDQQPRRSQTEAKAKRPDRPVIEANLSDGDWALFEDTWKRYKSMTSLSKVEDIRMELRASCSSDVNKLLFEFVGPATLDNATEAELLAHIKTVAVKGLHKEVHRMNFSKLKQGDGESITHYVARLKSQASLCGFFVACGCHEKVSYAEEMVAQQLIAGLRDQEHQGRVLSEATTLTTLQLKVERLQSLEATDESTMKLRIPPQATVAGAMRSNYKRAKMPPPKPMDERKKATSEGCTTCGRASHYGRSMTYKDCPAFKKKCIGCGKEGHFRRVCKSAKSKATTSQEQHDEYDEEEYSEASNTSFFFATQDKEDEQQDNEFSESRQDFRPSPASTDDG